MSLAADIFLTAAENDRLNVFHLVKSFLEQTYILARNDREVNDQLPRDYTTVNLREIAKSMDKTYGSVYNSYLQIFEDFKNITGKEELTSNDVFNHKSDLYRFYLMTNSYSYKFIKISLRDEHVTLNEFLEENKISKATAMRHFKSLRLHLKKYGIRMVYDEIGFVGDEQLIRLATTTLIWNGTNGIVWPFVMIDHDTIDELYQQIKRDFGIGEINQATSELFRYYIAVSIERILGNHIVDDNETLKLLRFPFPSTIKQFLENHNEGVLKDHPDLVELTESASLYLTMNILPFKYESIQPIDFLLKSIKHYNNSIYRFVEDFIDILPNEVVDKIGLSIIEKKTLRLNLAQTMVGVLATKSRYPVILDDFLGDEGFFLQDEDPATKKKVESSLEHLIYSHPETEFKKYIDIISYAFYQIIRRLNTFLKVNTKVNIALNIPVNTSSYTDIYNFISGMRIVNIQNYTDSGPDTDMLISSVKTPDDFDEKFPKAIVVKFGEKYSAAEYGMLTVLLMRIWSQKIQQQKKDALTSTN